MADLIERMMRAGQADLGERYGEAPYAPDETEREATAAFLRGAAVELLAALSEPSEAVMAAFRCAGADEFRDAIGYFAAENGVEIGSGENPAAAKGELSVTAGAAGKC